MNADNTDTGNEPFCSICLDDEEGQELLSGCCSCRGTSGHVHFPCIVENAQWKTKDTAERGGIERLDLLKIWLTCFTCKQYWTGATSASMGTECAAFIYNEFPDDEELKIKALGVKLTALSLLDYSSKEHAQACDDVLSAIEKYESTTQVQAVPSSILEEKCVVLIGKGQTLLQSDPSNAIECFEKSKDTLFQMGYTSDHVSVLHANITIAAAKAKLPGVDKKEALENLCQQKRHLFTVFKDEFGEGDSGTLYAGLTSSHTLIKLERFDEAKHLLMSLHCAYGQVHGRDHPDTKNIEELLQMVSDAMSNNSAS